MLCHQLEALRTKANLSYKQLASLCNLSETTITRVCSGETAEPSFSTVSSIVAACGGSLDDIAGIQRPPVYVGNNQHEFDTIVEKYEARIESTKQSYEQQIVQLNESHKQQVEQLDASHTREIDMLTTSNEKRVEQLNESFERRIKELNESFERRMDESAKRETSRMKEYTDREKRDNVRLYILLAAIAVLITVLVYFVLDALHGGWGLVRYQEMIAALNPSSATTGGGIGFML